MQKPIAYCGIDCSQCEAHLATLADDEAWKERIAASWRQAYNAPGITAASITCDGCTALAGARAGAYCYECEVRACGRQRGVENCAHCEDFDTCDHLARFFEHAPALKTTLEEIRRYL